MFERSFYCAVEPRYNEGLRDWKLNLFAMTRFFFIYFTVMTGVKKMNR